MTEDKLSATKKSELKKDSTKGNAKNDIATPQKVVVSSKAASSLKHKSAQKVRIKLKAYDYRILDQSSEKIVGTAQRSGAKVVGPVPLPTDKNVWCVLKSPHVNKRGGEHFEIRTHKRLIDIINPPATTIDALMQLDLPAGVDIEIKLS